VRDARPRSPKPPRWSAERRASRVMGRKAPRKRLARCVISAFTRVFDAIRRAQRVSHKHPNVSRRSAHPSIGVSEAKNKTWAQKAGAGARRCVVFDVVGKRNLQKNRKIRKRISAHGARDGALEAPSRSLILRSAPAGSIRRALGPAKNQPAGVVGGGPLLIDCSLQ